MLAVRSLRGSRCAIKQSTATVRTSGVWLCRRSFSTSPPSLSSGQAKNFTASDAAFLLDQSYTGSEIVRRQVIDANQLQKLSLTLGRRDLHGADISENPPVAGTPVPPGWHLVYFTPNGLESDLGLDGTDRIFNSPAPFTRRMWAGGTMEWPGDELRVGDEVEERTRLLKASPKKSSSSGDMVLVEVEKEFWGPRGLGLVDRR